MSSTFKSQAERSERKIFVNCGDPNGIGPEVTLKALASAPEKLRDGIILAGSIDVLLEINRFMGEPLTLLRVESTGDAAGISAIPVIVPEEADAYSPEYGRVSARAGGIAGGGIVRGVEACLRGETAALVTAPSCKEALHLAGYRYPGQTEMIADRAGAERHIMILAAGKLRVGMVTTHLALKEVSGSISRESIAEKIGVFRDTLVRFYGLDEPKIAVAALNPHGSDGGIFGNEEAEFIAPAVEASRQLGITVQGPFPADTLFSRGVEFDGILAMYHDQGMIPIKLTGFGRAVNLTGGLPFPRTSPDHGTAFDIAGEMRADPGSMLRAMEAAIEIAERIEKGHKSRNQIRQTAKSS